MALGTPVLTSNASSIPEVAGDAALQVDPYDTEQIAGAIRRLALDEDLCAELRSKGKARAALFSEQAYQRRVASMYQKVL